MPKEQPPRKLSGDRTVVEQKLWREVHTHASAEGITISGEKTEGAFTRGANAVHGMPMCSPSDTGTSKEAVWVH